MEKNIKFSIIIPVYNSKKYIKKCLKSVVAQTYTNYEAIIIDDGSTDGTSEILDRFALKYPQLKVFHQENAGEAFSRKKGINLASGDYVAFLDSDDWYGSDYLSFIYEKLNIENYSVVQCGYYKVIYNLKKPVSHQNEEIINNIDTIKDFINGWGKIDYAMCNKVYKTELIKSAVNQVNEKLIVGADAYLNMIFLSENINHKICIIDTPLYYYRQGSGITSSKDKIKIYKASMQFKSALYAFTEKRLADNSLLKSIFIDSAFITKYYSYLMTEKVSDKNECIRILSDVVFNNPTICSFIEKYSSVTFDNPECTLLIKRDIEEYYNFIRSCKSEYGSSSFLQKIINKIKNFIR